MRGQPHRNPSVRRHDEDIDIPVIFAREGDLRTVRRKSRMLLVAWIRGQADRVAALPRHPPQITRIDKDDGVAAERRFPKNQRRCLRGGSYQRPSRIEQRKATKKMHKF